MNITLFNILGIFYASLICELLEPLEGGKETLYKLENGDYN